MPYRAEKIPLPHALDRRRKLTDADRAAIKSAHQHGQSMRSLAKEYSVDKRTISIIVDESARKKMHDYIAKNWRKYVPAKDEHAKIIREYRRREHALMLAGELNVNK